MDFLMGILSTIFKVDEQINNRNRNRRTKDNITIESDIPYREDEALDIYYDRLATMPMPVLINVHGGGWMVGDKKWRKGIATIFAEHGFFVINPNYALSPARLYPECITDIFEVIDWVVDNAERYNLDLGRLYITGDSAGGHIAAMVSAIQHNEAELEKLHIPTPRAFITKVALFCGVYDYDKCVSQPGAQGLVGDMTGVEYGKYVDEYEYHDELSPINYVDETFPVTYMVSATLDIFCSGQAELLHERLMTLDIYHEWYVPEDKMATHCFHLNLDRADSIEALWGAVDFLKADITTLTNRK